MRAINMSACSSEFKNAFEALTAGMQVRRASWPEGQCLQKAEDGSLRVVRPGSTVLPSWAGPSSSEMDATDWAEV